MKENRKFFLSMLAFFITAGVIMIITEYLRRDVISEEARWMEDACVDIKAHETLRAEEDFDKIMKTVSSHLHSYRQESDTILAKAVIDLRILREEAEFHNGDLEFYHEKFADVLNRLSYLELEDAIYLSNHDQMEKALGAIHRAHHYLNDALFFSQNPRKIEEENMIHEINNLLKTEMKQQQIEASLYKMRQII